MTAGHTHADHDSQLDGALEQAEGVEVFANPVTRDLAAARTSEEAQGVETFANPDGAISPSAAREDDPGHETLSSEQSGLDGDQDEYRNAEEAWQG